TLSPIRRPVVRWRSSLTACPVASHSAALPKRGIHVRRTVLRTGRGIGPVRALALSSAYAGAALLVRQHCREPCPARRHFARSAHLLALGGGAGDPAAGKLDRTAAFVA